MNQELIAIIEQMEREKGIKKEVLFEAVESALLSAAKKVIDIKPDEDLKVQIDRETGNTSYQVIKDLKGSFSAFMWQSVARIFGSSLKYEYDADEEDKYIEEIIILIDNGQL